MCNFPIHNLISNYNITKLYSDFGASEAFEAHETWGPFEDARNGGSRNASSYSYSTFML